MLLSEQLLLNESMLLEAIADEGNLIFDEPDLIKLAKDIYATGNISIHALYPDERYGWSTYNRDAHMATIKKFLVADYNNFAKIYNDLLEKVKETKRQIALYSGSDKDYAKANNILTDFKNHGVIPCVAKRRNSKLFPYAQDLKTDYIMCLAFDGVHLHKIVINPKQNYIVTAYKISKSEVMRRAELFNSVELLSLATYGEITTDKKELYFAVKQLGTSPNVETSWLYKIGITPQTKQTEIRKLEAELKADPVTKTLVQ